MSRTEPWVYAVLLVVALGLAWSAWKDESPAAATSVVIFEAPSGGIKEILYELGPEKAHVVVTGGEDEARSTWITWTQPAPEPPKKKDDKPAPPEPAPTSASDAGPIADPDATPASDAAPSADVAASADAAVANTPDAAPADTPDAPPDAAIAATPEPTPTEPEPPAEPTAPAEPVVREFPGNNVMAALLADFDTLRALRQFDDVDDARLEAMGLKTPQGRLVVKAEGREVEFELGGTAYGAAHQYARPKGGGPVYLLSRDLVGPLKNASARLMERRLIPHEPDAIAAIEITAGPSTTRLLHRDRKKKAAAHWTRANDEEASEALAGFVDKLLQLSVVNFPAAAEQPDPKTLEPVLKAAVVGDDAPLVTFELARGQKQGAPTWYGRSTATRAWVELAEATAADVADNVGGVMP